MKKQVVLTLVMALIILSMTFGALAAFAQFEVTEAAISIRDASVAAGASTVMTATGFTEGELVSLSIAGVQVAQGRAITNGVYVATVVAPKLVPYNAAAVINARNGDGSKSVNSTVKLAPGLNVTPSSAAINQNIDVQGFAFSATEVYTVSFVDVYDLAATDCISTGATVSKTLGTGITSRVGSFLLNTTVPSVTAGSYYVVGIGGTSGTCALYK
jgi:hypothetical protein